MFDFFKRNVDNRIYAPVKGICMDITECSDKTFANKLMGDGFIIQPKEDMICSPCDGKLTMIFPTKHAFGLKMKNEQEILVHIGINTVNLNGEYFELIAKQNEQIKKGTPIVKCNFKKMIELGYEIPVMVIVTGKHETIKNKINELVSTSDVIIE